MLFRTVSNVQLYRRQKRKQGACAQPRRLPYSVLDDSGKYSMSSYILSTRDLSAMIFATTESRRYFIP